MPFGTEAPASRNASLTAGDNVCHLRRIAYDGLRLVPEAESPPYKRPPGLLLPELDADPAWRLAAAAGTRRAYFNDIRAWYGWWAEVGIHPWKRSVITSTVGSLS